MNNIENEKSRFKYLFKISFCIIILTLVLLINETSPFTVLASTEDSNNNEFCYLSDIPYVANQSAAGWKTICLDKTSDGALISVKVEGANYSFKKGIWAHATSTVVYDLTDYLGYDYFTAYIGLNTTAASSSNGVKFYIYTSEDGKNWNLKTDENPEVSKPGQNATFVKIDIRDAKFLKLYADANGSNGNDHSVYADAKLIKETYKEPGEGLVNSVEDLDKRIKTEFANADLSNKEYELVLLQRELVSNAGQYALKRFCSESEENQATLSWLMNDLDTLKLYILGGKPEGGSYYSSLNVLSKLYTKYKNDFEVKEVSKYGTVKGDLYKKMAITLSLTHSARVALWMQPSEPLNQSDAVTRYAIFKKMYDEGNFVVTDSIDITKWFESYNVEEMRFVLNNIIDDEEILWLNEYTQSFIDAQPNKAWTYLTPHPYMAYVYPNYGNPVFHDPDRKDYWDKKFNGIFSKYGVTYSSENKKIYKVWMNFRNEFGTGAVCGGISKTGSNIRTSHGIPAAVIGQPGHAAIIYYGQDNNGNGYWNLDNDVSGWTLSEKGERLLLGWGNANTNYARGSYQVVYMALAQEALNDYENFEKCEETVMLAKSYEGDLVKQEEIYRRALEIQPINLDAWLGLINVYNTSTTKTEDEYFELAREVGENLKYFPLPMQQLTNLIKPKLTSVENSYRFTLLQTRILTEGTKVPNNTADNYYVYQPSLTRTEANFLLGKLDKTIATFSFDGEDADKIVLSSRFDGNGVRWDYSLDGKQTWHEVAFSAEEEHKWQLTEEEIKSINAEDDIYIHIVGVNYNEENLYKIDITETNAPTLYNNDLENKVMGTTNIMEWRFNENDPWTSYATEEPDLTGDKTIQVRVAPSGTGLASDVTTLEFTQDEINPKRKYIKIAHLSIENVSSEATSNQGNASFAIDGNYYTRWHSAWNGSDTQKYITIKLDKPVILSAMDYFPAAGGNGKILQAQILGSMDGENFTEIKNVTWANNDTTKTIDFEEPVQVQYIKIVGARTSSGGGGNFIAARMFNFYEDTTIKIVADFSFDGTNGGKIILADEYKNSNWEYSIDGGNTWKAGNLSEHQLSEEELNQISEENKIKIRFNENEVYTINIKTGTVPTINAYLNDLENRLIGLDNKDILEWKLENDNNWTDYSEEEPVVVGDRKLLVRAKAKGLYTASDIIEYQFTQDTDTETQKYVPIKHLSIESYSTESADSARPFYALNAIDGNINTLWHTDFRYSVLEQEGNPFINIKLDEPRYMSALEFVQTKYKENDPDFIKNAIVYISEDGENWIEAGRIEECPQDNELRKITFNESIYGQYVKLEVETYGIFASVAMVNLYEDITKREEIVVPTAEIEYSTTEMTNQDVVATIVNPSTEITITNNDGKDTYTFTENGEFTFEFVDNKGTKGTIKAVVNWIDKVAPIGSVQYDITEMTNQNVTATLMTSEDVIVLNNDGKDTYTFTENGQFEFVFRDEAGNEAKTIAVVDWIDKEAPEATISYDITEDTIQDVVATIECDEEITIINNDGENTYTFTKNGEFEFIYTDKLGNEGRVTAKVDWIDREAPIGKVNYDITEITGNDVVATLEANEEITVTNNNGKNTYIFTENGEFEFTFIDKAGNEGKAIAKVDWIDKELPEITVIYNIENITNQDVTAKIESSKEITITNNDGEDEYTFTENGEFTFEYVTKAGKYGEVTVKVDWIDKEAPIARVSYDITEETTENVVATVEANEEIIITNNDGKDTYIFTENGEFEFTFRDEAGNEGRVVAKVDWIIEKEPEPSDNPTPSPSDNPTPSPSDNPTPSPSDNPTPSPSDNPTPSPSDNPTPSPSDNPTPSPSDKPTSSPSDKPTSTPDNKPNTSTQPSQDNNSNNSGNKTTGTNSNIVKGEEKTTETQTKTTTSNSDLPYTGYEDISVAFRRIFLTISILALLVIAVYSFYKMKK